MREFLYNNLNLKLFFLCYTVLKTIFSLLKNSPIYIFFLFQIVSMHKHLWSVIEVQDKRSTL